MPKKKTDDNDKKKDENDVDKNNKAEVSELASNEDLKKKERYQINL